MSLNILVMNPVPLVRTLFVILLYVLKIPLLVFFCLAFLHQQESNPKVVVSFQYFALILRFGIFVPNLKISFIFSLSVVSHCISKRCSFPYSMLRQAPMGDIWRPSDSGSHELWSRGLDGPSRDIHPAAQIDIPTRTVVEFITDYLTPGRGRN